MVCLLTCREWTGPLDLWRQKGKKGDMTHKWMLGKILWKYYAIIYYCIVFIIIIIKYTIYFTLRQTWVSKIQSLQTVCWPHLNNKNRWMWNFRELEAAYLPGEPNSKLVTALFYKTVPAENHKNHKSNTRAETDIFSDFNLATLTEFKCLRNNDVQTNHIIMK